jgi:hypothetical protein
MNNMMDGFFGNIGQQTNAANQMQMQQQDQINANEIMMQMAASQQKAKMKQWQIQMDMMTKIYETQQEVTMTMAKMSDKAIGKWDQFINQ